MNKSNMDVAIEKIIQMPEETVLKVLIFMAGMEAEHATKKVTKNRILKADGDTLQSNDYTD